MKAIIVSDLHMGSRYFRSQAFENFLNSLPDIDEFILNGDVLDRPHVKLTPFHQLNLERIEKLSLRCKVVWVRGNHDQGYMPASLGKIEFCRRYTFDNRILITHGDAFDNVMARSRIFMKAFSMMHDLRVRLGARPVHVAEYAKKWKAFYRVLRNNVMRNAVNFAAENGFEAVTCGHTHFAEDVVFNGVRYINTGAWTEFPAHYLHVTPEAMVLNGVDEAMPEGPGRHPALATENTQSSPLNCSPSTTASGHVIL
ncbi:MAG: metallophosphoesterase [Desulfobacteraceae bacterium]|jgi:UDP-2,3-diacylglucosamine pyrophosphatase LpxH|nr:metallophosphoesterase [Desulfobacteraceae bacterium]